MREIRCIFTVRSVKHISPNLDSMFEIRVFRMVDVRVQHEETVVFSPTLLAQFKW